MENGTPIYRESLAEIRGGKPWSKAEEKLLAECHWANICMIGKEVPEEDEEDKFIRAPLIRFLLLGGDEEYRPAARGVSIVGAVITDWLNLTSVITNLSLMCGACRFIKEPCMRDASLNGLFLKKSHFPGLNLHRLQSKSSLLLDGINSTGQIDLNGAKISGQLNCSNAELLHTENDCDEVALQLQQATINGDAILRETKIKGKVDLSSAKVTDTLEVLQIEGKAGFDLRQTLINHLHDDQTAWQGEYYLDGFKYNTLVEPSNSKSRMEWLKGAADIKISFTPMTKHIKKRFRPMPYVQLAQTFARQGLRNDAAHILFERDKAQTEFDWERMPPRNDRTFSTDFARIAVFLLYIWRYIIGITFGHGHLPMRGFVSFITLVVIATFLYGHINTQGKMAPNHAVILISDEWNAAVQEHENCELVAQNTCTLPTEIWADNPTVADYETFDPIGYGFDIVLPLVSFGQEAAWAPSHKRGGLAVFGYYMRWVFQALGWILAIMGAGVITGLIGRKD